MKDKRKRWIEVACAAIIVLIVFGVRMCFHMATNGSSDAKQFENNTTTVMSPEDERLVDSVENARHQRFVRHNLRDSLKRLKKPSKMPRLRSPLDEHIQSEKNN